MVIFLTPCRRAASSKLTVPSDIDALIQGRFGQTGPDAGAGGQVDNLVEFRAGEEFRHALRVRQVPVTKNKRLLEGEDFPQVLLFDGDIVKRIQVVQDPDGMSRAEQPLAKMGADEPRAACDQKIHVVARANDAWRDTLWRMDRVWRSGG